MCNTHYFSCLNEMWNCDELWESHVIIAWLGFYEITFQMAWRKTMPQLAQVCCSYDLLWSLTVEMSAFHLHRNLKQTQIEGYSSTEHFTNRLTQVANCEQWLTAVERYCSPYFSPLFYWLSPSIRRQPTGSKVRHNKRDVNQKMTSKSNTRQREAALCNP